MQDGKRRYCPTGKLKHFNKAWADLTAERQSEEFGSRFRSYRCGCGWWHTYNRSKRTTKENQRESRNTRRRRVRQGDPPPYQTLLMQQERERRRMANLRRKRRAILPLRVWEDDGGMCVWDRGSEE